MSQHPDLVIVGGGVIGLSTAWYASGLGARVTVVDQGEMGRQASWAGAGIIPPVQQKWKELRSPANRLRGLSYELWPGLSAELREMTRLDNHFLKCGGVEFSDPSGHGECFPVEEWHTGNVEYDIMWGSRLRRIEPLLGPGFMRGVYFPDLAQVRNPRHLHALATACAARGVRLLPNWPVVGLARVERRVVGVETATSRLFADRVLLASGAWTDRLLDELNITLGVKPVRGQMVLFHTGRAGSHPVVMQGSRYLVPRLDGRLLAGSTEEDVGFDTSTTDDGIAGLVAFARQVMPSLGSAPVEQTWAGLRPGTPDGLPYLGAVPGVENLYVAAGHFRSGLQLSPGTGLVMAQLLLEQAPAVDLSAFSLGRAAAQPA